jgi:hypothetical protein
MGVLEHGCRLGQIAETLHETGGRRAVYHGVVEAQCQRQHRPGHDAPVADHRPVHNADRGDQRQRRDRDGPSPPRENIPSQVTPTAGPNRAAIRGLVPASRMALRRRGPGRRATCAATPRRAGAWSGVCLARRSSPEMAAHDFWSAARIVTAPSTTPALVCRSTVAPTSIRLKRRTARGCRPGGRSPPGAGQPPAPPWRSRSRSTTLAAPIRPAASSPARHRTPPARAPGTAGLPGQGVQHHLAAARHWPDHVTRGAVTAGWGAAADVIQGWDPSWSPGRRGTPAPPAGPGHPGPPGRVRQIRG